MIAASFSLTLYCLFVFYSPPHPGIYKPPEASWEALCTNRSDALATALPWKVISGQEEASSWDSPWDWLLLMLGCSSSLARLLLQPVTPAFYQTAVENSAKPALAAWKAELPVKPCLVRDCFLSSFTEGLGAILPPWNHAAVERMDNLFVS